MKDEQNDSFLTTAMCKSASKIPSNWLLNASRLFNAFRQAQRALPHTCLMLRDLTVQQKFAEILAVPRAPHAKLRSS